MIWENPILKEGSERMKFIMKVTMDNAAFEDGCQGWELARILVRTAAKVKDMTDMEPGESLCSITDINGNNVGTAKITK